MRQVPVSSARDFARCKAERRKISIVTAYDFWSARIVARSTVDAILIGDSAAMVVQGHATTLPATVRDMVGHTRAVARGAEGRFLIADLPFLSYRMGIAPAMRAVRALVAAGAHAVKLEGVDGHEDVIARIVGSGVPVMGHVGLTPQSVRGIGGYRVQGRGDDDAATVCRQARALAELGCFAIVLECVPAPLAERITAAVGVPTIGIGAGAGTDGQVLVLHDLLGLGSEHAPKFVRRYLDGDALITGALNAFDRDVKELQFPGPAETYS